ncbi:MAG: hypothetical protein HUU08_08175 [Candidatus Brocadia sp.]|nr:hypothetical protein [Candidatus Brocadia sp.]
MTDSKDFPQLIPPHDGYRNLQSYQTAEIVYNTTVVALLKGSIARAQKE